MNLKKIVINGFRSIKKQEVFYVENKITILIGANDHGKTNILNAAEYLNDEKEFVADDTNWDIESDSEMYIEWHFDISDEDLKKIEAFKIEEIPNENSHIQVKEGEVVYVRNFKENIVKVATVPFQVPESALVEILKLRPRIELFVLPSTNLKDQVSLAELEKAEFEFMQGIFRLAGLWDLRKEIFKQDGKTSKLLAEGSEKLTEVLNDKWNQGKELKWKLTHSGTNGDHITIEIVDPSISSKYTRPSLRSAGFCTYFMLSMIIYARTENKNANSFIYLFDEPGTYLHPRAQLDLQRSFELIADKTQIIYTTHSLFLINKNYPDRNRVVSKTIIGTKIDQKPFQKNWKSVRESLGILLSNNFLIAEKSLLVEGPSDVIYLLHAIKRLKMDGKVDIDLNDLSIVDAGSSDNYIAMAKLMIAEGRDVVAILDGDGAGSNLQNKLKKTCEKEIKNKKIQIKSLPKGKSIEDIFTDKEMLMGAIKAVFNDLSSIEERKPKKEMNIDNAIKEIMQDNTEEKTLGKKIDDHTATWYEKEEKISKLSIALKYEDSVVENNNTLKTELSVEAENEIKDIKSKLGIKGEKNEENKIFEEIS